MKKLVLISSFLVAAVGSAYGQSWPRFFWEQVEAADTLGAIAVADADGNGYWSDSLRWENGFLYALTDTVATRAYARSVGGGGGGSFDDFTVTDGTTYTVISDGDTLQILGSSNGIDVSLSGSAATIDLDFSELGSAIGISSTDDFVAYNSASGTEKRFPQSEVEEKFEDHFGNNVMQAGYGLDMTYGDTGGTITYEADTTELATQYDISGFGTGTMDDFTITSSPDFSYYNVVADGDTLTFSGSAGVDVAVDGSGNVTTSLDFSELTTTSTFDSNDNLVLYDGTSADERMIARADFYEELEDEFGNNVMQAGYGLDVTYSDAGGTITYEADTTELATQYDISGFGSGTVTGTGTNQTFAVWNSAGTGIENSTFVLENANGVGINQASPGYKLDVYNASGNVVRVANSTTETRLSGNGLQTTATEWSAGDASYGAAFRMRNLSSNYNLVIRNGRVGIGNQNPGFSLDLSPNTDAIRIPAGTTAQRPGGASDGVLRFNTTLNRFEGYYNSIGSWSQIDYWRLNGSYLEYDDGSADIFVKSDQIYNTATTLNIGANSNGSAFYINNAANYTLTLASGQKVGINDNTPSYSLDINGTDAIKIPTGTTAQRPTATTGLLRYNTTAGNIEWYNGSSWTSPGTGTGSMDDWTWGANNEGSSTTTVISDGETVLVSTGSSTGLDATLSGNTVTISYDFGELTEDTTPAASDIFVAYTGAAYRKMQLGNLYKAIDRGYAGQRVISARNSAVGTTYELINATDAGTVNAFGVNNFTSTSANKITYNGSSGHMFKIEAVITAYTGASSDQLTFNFGVNGSTTGIYAEASYVWPDTNVKNIKICTLETLANGDYIEIFAKTLSGSVDLYVDEVQFIITEVY